DGRVIRGAEMTKLCTILADMEDAVIALERRGISLRAHALRRDADGKLPIYHVFVGTQDRWFVSRAELDQYLAEQEQAAGKELAVEESPEVAEKDVTQNGNGKPGSLIHMTELHEVKTINAGLSDL